jgi:murein DD-endopeptidase MepM/ murein hydrolase activator NlpD
MNPKLILTLFSFRREITSILTTFLLVISLPIIAVIVITKVGVDIVSEKLVSYNSITHEVVILNPIDGSIYKRLSQTFVWPVKGVITLEFGESSIFQPFHAGIDIANPNGNKGDPITVFMPGKVTYTGSIILGYGKHVIVDNKDNITSVYAHLDSINVEKGQEVNPGDIIGTEGKTGWATGNHLHFEVRVFGIPVNPRTFLGF